MKFTASLCHHCVAAAGDPSFRTPFFSRSARSGSKATLAVHTEPLAGSPIVVTSSPEMTAAPMGAEQGVVDAWRAGLTPVRAVLAGCRIAHTKA